MKRMKKTGWILFLFLLLAACLAVAAALFMIREVLWGVGMLVCALGCCLLLFVEGYERGWDSAKELRLETMEILCRSDALLSLGEDMFWGMQTANADREGLYAVETEEERSV